MGLEDELDRIGVAAHSAAAFYVTSFNPRSPADMALVLSALAQECFMGAIEAIGTAETLTILDALRARIASDPPKASWFDRPENQGPKQ